MPFLIIFVFIPLLEISVFLAVGEHIGILTTLMLAFLTAIIGGALVRMQGLQTILKMRESLGRGQMPLGEIFDGFCLVAAGAMLITPGFVTDTAGFLLLIPAVRNAVKAYLKNHTRWMVEGETYQNPPHNAPGSHNFHDSGVIEGEYERVGDRDHDRKPGQDP